MERINPPESYSASGVYVIECKINGKVYIGAAARLNTRLNYHKSALRLKRHPNKYLQSDYNKFGSDNFSFKVLVLCSTHLLDLMESKAFELYQCNDRILGYNIWGAGKKNRKPNNELLDKMHVQGKNSLLTKRLSKKVIDTSTNKVYGSIGDASKNYDIAFRTLCRWLQYPDKNKSNLRYA